MQVIEVENLEEYRDEFVNLLCDCVDDGASIGFVAPLKKAESSRYWSGVVSDLSDYSKRLFLAQVNGEIIETVQLSLCQKENGLHRAEVEKLMVHTNARGQGAGKALMFALEKRAQYLKRSLLVLDTCKVEAGTVLMRPF